MSKVLKRKFKVNKKTKLTIVETFVLCGGSHLGFKLMI